MEALAKHFDNADEEEYADHNKNVKNIFTNLS
jgi:hypothetical protein